MVPYLWSTALLEHIILTGYPLCLVTIKGLFVGKEFDLEINQHLLYTWNPGISHELTNNYGMIRPSIVTGTALTYKIGGNGIETPAECGHKVPSSRCNSLPMSRRGFFTKAFLLVSEN